MESDSSNKRISNIIAGILLVFVAFVFIAIALGVVWDHLYIQDKMDPLKSGSQFNLVDDPSDLSLSGDIGNNDFVPVAQNFPDLTRYHTEAGSITNIQDELLDGATDFDGDGIIENNIDIDDLGDEFYFPLFIDPTDPIEMGVFLNNWYKIVEVEGGYSPCLDPSATQRFNLYQQDKVTGEWERVEYTDASGLTTWIGWSLTWIPITLADISILTVDLSQYSHVDITLDPQINWNTECRTYWVAIIDTSCDNIGKVDSCQTPNNVHLSGKALKLSLETTWKGCPDQTQHFVYLLVQIFRIPNSRINI
jgi:hypothetical protein